MKIAIHVDGPAIRGSERQVIRIAAGLRARGHDVAVSCRAGGPVEAELRALGVRTTGIRPRGDADVWNGLRFVRWLRRERPDAVLLTSWKRLFGGSVAARMAGVPRVVYRLGGPQRVPAGGPSAWKYLHAFRRGVDRIVVNSAELRERVHETAPAFPPDRVSVVPNAAPPRAAAAPAARAELGAGAEDVLMVSVGTLARHKGFDLLIGALSRLPPYVRLAVAGDGPLRDELPRLAAARGVAGRVRLLGERGDVPALLAAADAFVLPSRLDSMANAMLEAMAAGLPVVATEFMGARDALAPRDGRPAAGWLVPADDEDALAGALREVVDGIRARAPEVAGRGAEAAWRCEHWFGVERMIDGYEAALAGREPAP
jgi:glycosyltransferase involved in cell wall biosynthesis